MTRPRSDLLEVVPWSFGFAHAFALRWLLRESHIAPLVLSAAKGFGLPPKARVSDVESERKGGRGRADLRFELEVSSEDVRTVDVEIKVNDWVDRGQLSAYGGDTILYTPGLTGLLISRGHVSLPKVARLTGIGLAESLEDLGGALPELIASYVDAVRDEAVRMERARAVVLGEASADTVAERDGRPSALDLQDAAWVTEAAAALAGNAGEVTIRVTRHDRGLKWDVGGQFGDGTGSWLWIDLLATLGNRREIRVKANGPARAAIHAAAKLQCTPSAAHWFWCRRTTTSDTSSIVGLDVTGYSLTETTAAANAAADWTATLARAG